MKAVIEVKGLSKNYGNFTAVKDLNFSVYEGDVFGFLGQNGAGKSTTIRMLLTLIRPSSGNIRIFDENLEDNRKSILRKIGAIIEKPDLYKYLSANENLSLFAKMSGLKITRKTMMDQLELVGLADRSNSKVGTFSQGMKQRLGIAVALIHDPDLILLDEPTNGLDPQGIADVRNLIGRLSTERKKTILVSSHLLSEIEIISNRMLIVHKGEKVVEGEVKNLLDPSKTIVKIETENIRAGFEILNTSVWNKNLNLKDNLIHVEMQKKDIPTLVQFLVQHNIAIEKVQPLHSLEDYFLNLTKTSDHV